MLERINKLASIENKRPLPIRNIQKISHFSYPTFSNDDMIKCKNYKFIDKDKIQIDMINRIKQLSTLYN
jgi:hypothetical protein